MSYRLALAAKTAEIKQVVAEIWARIGEPPQCSCYRFAATPFYNHWFVYAALSAVLNVFPVFMENRNDDGDIYINTYL